MASSFKWTTRKWRYFGSQNFTKPLSRVKEDRMGRSEARSINHWERLLRENGLIGIIMATVSKRLAWQSINGEWHAFAANLRQHPRHKVFRLTANGLGNKWNSQLVHPDDSPDRYAELVETIFLQEVLRED
jgi:hypothetical protein